MNGEISLEQEVQLIFPKAMTSESLQNEFRIPIEKALNSTQLGRIVRTYQIELTSGIDIELHDFVQGVDLLRKLLIELNAPHGTLIEYDHGDLAIYEF